MSLERLKKGMILSQRDPSDLSSAERTEAMLFYTSEIHGSLMSIWGSMNQDGMKTETDTFRNLEELKKQIDSLADSVQTPPNDGKWDYEVYKERGQNFIHLLNSTVMPVLKNNRENNQGDVLLHTKAMESDLLKAHQRFDGLVKYIRQLASISKTGERIETMRNNQRSITRWSN